MYSKQLSELLPLFGIDEAPDVLITDLCIDSRKASTGSLFLAYPGSNNDGRDFIRAAIENGAVAVLYESIAFEELQGLPVPAFGVAGLMRKVGAVASAFFDHPSHELQVFGVTGTNGKTTCAYLLTQAFELLGMKSAFIGTLGIGAVSSIRTATHTTPDPISLQRTLAQLLSEGVTQVSMEVSSHALHQGRVAGVEFYGVMFTNLTQDHLDYHATMDDYGAAKARLFTDFESKLAVINAQDTFGATLLDKAVSEFIVSYGETSGDVYSEDLSLDTQGITFTACTENVDFDVVTPLIGSVNLPNLLLVAATLLSLSTPIDQIKSIFTKLKPAPGRMELFTKAKFPQLVVDYAHTPDALAKAIDSVRHHCKGKLWCVFGCGGDRDRAKRALMGAAAGSADQIVITNDNPRSEDPQDIANEILAGMNDVQSAIHVELDRAAAIRYAVSHASPDDWILVAGKGHETTQTIGSQVLDFSDREFAQALLNEEVGK